MIIDGYIAPDIVKAMEDGIKPSEVLEAVKAYDLAKAEGWSEEEYTEHLLEKGDRSHLVKKMVTDSRGHRTTRWVKPGGGGGDAAMPKKKDGGGDGGSGGGNNLSNYHQLESKLKACKKLKSIKEKIHIAEIMYKKSGISPEQKSKNKESMTKYWRSRRF